MTLRAAIYARYSSDLQSAASIEDQIRLCRQRIEREGWSLIATHVDRATSGASHLRPGFQALLEQGRAGGFDLVVAEALDRLSRDQEHIAAFYKQLSFAGVRILTLADGLIDELHVGLKGTMNALFLKDLAAKTRRGLQGRIEAGCSAGANTYGYDVVRELDSRGNPVHGNRQINAAQADVVRRIFEDFVAGKSPRAIAAALNGEAVIGPRGGPWGASTIHGNATRGTGILNNELYVGRLVWNRLRYVKDPQTGRRISRANPAEDVLMHDVPELRIVSDALWQAARARHQAARKAIRPDNGRKELWHARRTRYLLSGLIHCGACGGPMVIVGKTYYGCANHKYRGLCANRLTMRRDILERSVLDGLARHLVTPELVAEFVAEYHRERKRLAAGAAAREQAARGELAAIDRQIGAIVQAVKDGLYHPSLKAELAARGPRGAARERDRTPPPGAAVLPPTLPALSRRKVEALQEDLTRPEIRAEAAEALRALIEQIRLVPQDGILAIDLYGTLAGLLSATNANAARMVPGGGSTVLVAGAGFEPTTFRL